ncbi:hypothetical protein M0813_10609 [Anaeramoeba flamelloides]|uniref:Uncharacterized protein n=1 Tax=Anaeramoeba flamelloides TaxID=1746091 RepID=A0ABQ8X263_9EUKA|nr:hypothetical protein M0813_10609 [Anaeramoeba flamelloides]
MSLGSDRLKIIPWMRDVINERFSIKITENEFLDYSLKVLKKLQPSLNNSFEDLNPNERLDLLLEGCQKFQVADQYLLLGNKSLTMKRLMTLMKGVGMRADELSFQPSFSTIKPLRLKRKSTNKLTQSQKSRLISRSPVKKTESGRAIFLTPMKRNDKRRKDSLVLSPFFTLRGPNQKYSDPSPQNKKSTTKNIQEIQQLFANCRAEFNMHMIQEAKGSIPKEQLKANIIIEVLKFTIMLENGQSYVYRYENIKNSKVRLSRNDTTLVQLVIIENKCFDEIEKKNENEKTAKKMLMETEKQERQNERKFLLRAKSVDQRHIFSKCYQLYQYYSGISPEQTTLSGDILNYKNEQIALTLRCLTNGTATFKVKLVDEQNKHFANGLLQIQNELFIIHPIGSKKNINKNKTKDRIRIRSKEENPLTVYWDEVIIKTNINEETPKTLEIIMIDESSNLTGVVLMCRNRKKRDLINKCIHGFQSKRTDSFFLIKDQSNPKNKSKLKPFGTFKKQQMKIQLFPESPKKSVDFEYFETLELQNIRKVQNSYFAIFDDNGNSPIINLQSKKPFCLENYSNSPLLNYFDKKNDRNKILNSNLNKIINNGQIIFKIEILFFKEKEKEKEKVEGEGEKQKTKIDKKVIETIQKTKEVNGIDFSESIDENNHKKEVEKIFIQDKINFELTDSEIIINLIDTKEIILKTKYSMGQKLFAHSEQLNKFIYVDSNENKYVFNCNSVLTRDLILNSYFIFREQFLNNKPLKNKKKIKKVITNQIKIISPKNVYDKFQYKSKLQSIYKYPINDDNDDDDNDDDNGINKNKHYYYNNNKNNNNKQYQNNSNQKYATYEIQFYNSLEEHIGPGEILLFNDHFLLNFYSEKIARYYSAYSKPLLLNQSSVFCRFHIDEKEYVNIAFSNMKQRNIFITGFNNRLKMSLKISNYSTRSVYKSMILKKSGEMIPIKIILRFDCFVIKSNFSILHCEYLPNTVLSFSNTDTGLIRINLGLGHSSIKCLFQNGVSVKQFIKGFETFKYKWLSGSFENPCYYFNNIKLISNAYKESERNNIEIILTNTRMLLIEKNSKPILLKNYSIIKSQIFQDPYNNLKNNNKNNKCKIILNNKTKLIFLFNSEKENRQFRKIYKKINNLIPSDKTKLYSLRNKIILDSKTKNLKMQSSNSSTLFSLTFYISFLNKKYSNSQGILKLFYKYIIIHNDTFTIRSKIENVNVMLNSLNSCILEISFKNYSFYITFLNPKHRQYFIWKFCSIKKQLQIPNYLPVGLEYPLLSFKYGNNQTISKRQSLPLYIKLLKKHFILIFENEFFKYAYHNLRIIIDANEKCKFNIFLNKKIKFKGVLPDECLTQEFVKMFTMFEEISSIQDTFLNALSNFGKNLNHKKSKSQQNSTNFDEKNQSFKVNYVDKDNKVLSNGQIIIDHLNDKLIVLNLPNHKNYLEFEITNGISLFKNKINTNIFSVKLANNIQFYIQFINAKSNQNFVSQIKSIQKNYLKLLSDFIKNRKPKNVISKKN